MVEETRYWPRLGLRVTKKMALEAAERMSGQASFYDDEMEEFVMTDNSTTSAVKEVEDLFSNPDESDKNADAKHTVILKTMELHKQRRKKIIEYRKQLKNHTLENASELYEQLIEDGYTPENAQKEIDVRTKADKDAKVNEMYTEWLDEKVIALQKEHGIYEERHIIDIDEEE